MPTSGQKDLPFTAQSTPRETQTALYSAEQKRAFQSSQMSAFSSERRDHRLNSADPEDEEYQDGTRNHENENDCEGNEDDSRDHDEDQDEHDEHDDDSPNTPLPNFDWSDLENRYRAMIAQKVTEEAEVWEEFCKITDYFGAWCSASSRHETNRGLKRHKTQAYFVRAEEQQLEERRKHYVKVIEAFRSALSMLEG